MMKRVLLFVLLVSVIVSALPQAEESGWVHLNNKSEIRSIYRQGNSLWLGTNGGLLIYDLPRREIIEEHLIGENLPSSSIWVIAGRGETVYIGSDGGLSVVEDGNFRIKPSAAASLRNVRSIDFGPGGDICIGTYGGGAGIIHQDELARVTRADSLLDDRVYAVIELDDSTYYYATSYGVCAFKDSLWWNYRVGAGLPKGEALDLILTEDYAMYALIAGGGVFFFDGSRGRRISPMGLFVEDEIAAVALEENQTLWAAGGFGRIRKYRGGKWSGVGEKDPDIERGRWMSAYAHEQGSVYFGSAGGLIVSIDNGKMQKLTIPSSLPSNNIRAMQEDSTGRMYIAAGNDLLTIPPDKGDCVTEPLEGPVTAMAVSPLGEFYCCTRWGVFQKVSGRFEEITPDHGGRVTVATAMAFDREGRLWLGTDRGEVLRRDESLWLCLGERDELTGGEVTAILRDEPGNMWAFSPQTGVARFEGNRWKRFHLENFGGRPLSGIVIAKDDRPVIAGADTLWQYQGGDAWGLLEFPKLEAGVRLTELYCDRSGKLYAGTTEGLYLVSGKSSRYIRPRTGLAGKNVSSLLVDRGGVLWVGFRNDGISYTEADRLW